MGCCVSLSGNDRSPPRVPPGSTGRPDSRSARADRAYVARPSRGIFGLQQAQSEADRTGLATRDALTGPTTSTMQTAANRDETVKMNRGIPIGGLRPMASAFGVRREMPADNHDRRACRRPVRAKAMISSLSVPAPQAAGTRRVRTTARIHRAKTSSRCISANLMRRRANRRRVPSSLAHPIAQPARMRQRGEKSTGRRLSGSTIDKVPELGALVEVGHARHGRLQAPVAPGC